MIHLAFAGFLAGAVAVAVPIFLHFLNKRPVGETPFPSFFLLHATVARKQTRNRLRKWLVLLLRCVALTALAVAFAMPYIPQVTTVPTEATVILWDDSFSMTGQPYAADLRRQMLAQLAQAGSDRPTIVGLVGGRIRWSGSAFSSVADDLKSWFLAESRPEGASSFDSALRQADARLCATSARTKRIILITDRHALPWKNLRWAEPLSAGVTLELVTPAGLERKLRNAAIFTARCVEGSAGGAARELELTVEADNFSESALTGELVAVVGEREVARRAVTLPPLSRSAFALRLSGVAPPPPGGLPVAGQVQLLVADELAADNRAFFAVNPELPPQVCATALPSVATDFIGLALNPDPSRPNVQFAPFDERTPAVRLRGARLLILRANTLVTPGLAKTLDQALTEGARVLAVCGRGNATQRAWLARHGVKATTPVASVRRLEMIDFDHPVFAKFADVRVGSLFDLLFFQSPTLVLPDTAQTVAAFAENEPFFAELPVGSGTLFVLATGLERADTNWVANAAFLPFLRELLAYCRTDEAVAELARAEPGIRPLSLPGLQAVTQLSAQTVVPCANESFTPLAAGNYRCTFRDGHQRVISVNRPTRESNPALADSTVDPARIAWRRPSPARTVGTLTTADPGAEQGRQFSRLLLVLALACVLAELPLANRTAV